MTEKPIFNYKKELALLKETFNFDFIAIALIQSNEYGVAPKWECAVGNRGERVKRIVLKSGKGIAGNVLKTGKEMLVTDVEQAFGKTELFNYPIIFAEGLKSFGAIPLYRNNRVDAILLAAYRTGQQMNVQKFDQLKRAVEAKFCPYYQRELMTC